MKISEQIPRMLIFDDMKTNCRLITHFILGLLILGVGACGYSDKFKVKGTISDGSSINLRFVYYTDNSVRTALTASTDGKFSFEGVAANPAVVEVYDNDYRLLSRFFAQNGDDIELRIDRKNPYRGKAAGNKLSNELTAFYNEKADILTGTDSRHRNEAIAEYVGAHPESPVAQLILIAEFDASDDEAALMCDSLMNSLTTDARVLNIGEQFASMTNRITAGMSRMPVTDITYKTKGNNTGTFVAQDNRLSLISISDGTHGRDSVLEALRKLAGHEKKGRFMILDLNVDPDTIVWIRAVRRDSASWEQGWVAGSIAGQALDRLGIPTVPYFILVDSSGSQMWRGQSVSQSSKMVQTALKQLK